MFLKLITFTFFFGFLTTAQAGTCENEGWVDCTFTYQCDTNPPGPEQTVTDGDSYCNDAELLAATIALCAGLEGLAGNNCQPDGYIDLGCDCGLSSES